MYLDQLGLVREVRDFAQNRYAFGKLDEAARRELLEAQSGPDSLHTRAWAAYLAPYRARETGETVQPLPLHPDTAEAIVAWVEAGELSRSPDGSRVWREYLLPLWPRLLATLKNEEKAWT